MAILLGIAVLVIAAALAAALVIGPRMGLWLIPPSPQRYADTALDLMDAGYYADSPTWIQARADAVDATRNAETLADTYPALEAAAAVAGGKHSSFRSPERARGNDADATAEFVAPTLVSSEGVTTIAVPELGGVSTELQQQYADAAAHGIADAASATCGWIVDLRQNRGGTMYPMLAGVAPLLPDGTALEFETVGGTRTPATLTEGGIAVGSGSPALATSVRTKVTGQDVAVLQDEMTASSGEAVLTAFRGLPGVETFGTPSAGYASANQVFDLYDGARLMLTTAAYVDRNGVVLPEAPLAPDHTTTAADAPGAAAEWLRQGSCG